jgi:hypothetical protein
MRFNCSYQPSIVPWCGLYSAHERDGPLGARNKGILLMKYDIEGILTQSDIIYKELKEKVRDHFPRTKVKYILTLMNSTKLR